MTDPHLFRQSEEKTWGEKCQPKYTPGDNIWKQIVWKKKQAQKTDPELIHRSRLASELPYRKKASQSPGPHTAGLNPCTPLPTTGV